MPIGRESGERESSSSRAINYNAYHQIGGVGRGGFGARQLKTKKLKTTNFNQQKLRYYIQKILQLWQSLNVTSSTHVKALIGKI